MTDKNRVIEKQTIIECFLFSAANGTLDSLSDDSRMAEVTRRYWQRVSNGMTGTSPFGLRSNDNF